MKIVCTNRQAKFRYFLEETYEAGIVLNGPEVKSLREGKANMSDSYANFKGEELFLIHCHISPYKNARVENQEPTRDRKLLLHKLELNRLLGKIREKGYTLIPTKIYFNEKGKAKIELALGKGKKGSDKRETIKRRETQREMQRMIRKGK